MQKRSTQVTERGCSSGGRLLRSLRLLRRQLGRLAGWAVRLQLAAPRQHLALGRLLVHAAAAVGCSAVTRQLLLPTEPVVCRQAGRQAQGASPGGPSGPAGRPPGRSPAGGTATPPAALRPSSCRPPAAAPAAGASPPAPHHTSAPQPPAAAAAAARPRQRPVSERAAAAAARLHTHTHAHAILPSSLALAGRGAPSRTPQQNSKAARTAPHPAPPR